MRRLAQRIGLGLVLMGTMGTASAQLPTPHGVWGGNPLRPAVRLPSVVPAQFSEAIPFSNTTPSAPSSPNGIMVPADGPSGLGGPGLTTPGMGSPGMASPGMGTPGLGTPGPVLPPPESEMEPAPTTMAPDDTIMAPGSTGAGNGAVEPDLNYSPDNPLGFGDNSQAWDGTTQGGMAANGAGMAPVPMSIQPVWEGAMGDQMMVDGPARLFSTREWFRSGRWYGSTDFVLLTMVSTRNVPVAVDTTSGFSRAIDPLTGQVLGGIPTLGTPVARDLTAVQTQLGTESARFNFQPGVNLRLGRFLGRDEMNRDHAIEVGFFGLFDYSSQSTLTESAPGLGIPVGNNGETAPLPGIVTMLGNGINQTALAQSLSPVLLLLNSTAAGGIAPGFINGNTATIYNDATFNNGEVNWQVMARPRRDRLVLQPNGEWVQHSSPSQTRAFLAGFRYVQLDESFTYAQFGDNAAQDNGLYKVDVTNDMFGLQMGGRLQEVYSNWQWDLETKVGGLWNFAGRDSLVSTTISGTQSSRSQSLTDEQLGIVLQLGVGGAYRITPNFAVTTVYNVIYLNNVATTIDNLSLAPAFQLFDLSGDRLFHGLSTGVQLTW
ncbi:MAG: BBP7 family outer membrane beta-barrel protein [Pirellulales bacterium]